MQFEWGPWDRTELKDLILEKLATSTSRYIRTIKHVQNEWDNDDAKSATNSAEPLY